MLPKIESIKLNRIKLGLTQKMLADRVGVSTSMINQIESGRSKPSYDTAKKIFDNLAVIEAKSSLHKAGDFSNKTIIKLKPTNTLQDAIKKMHKFSISQIPIFDGKDPVGLITDDSIVKHLDDPNHIMMKVELSQVMESVPPIVNYDTPANVLVPLIRVTKCVLVSKNTKVIGIITASDALKIMDV